MAACSVVPDYFWVFHFHTEYITKKLGTINGPDAYKRAVEKIQQYNEKNGAELGKITQTADGKTVVAIIDQFCRRVHENMPQAADIVFIDATSNLDRLDCKLFHLICPSAAGGLPLGNVITSRENEATVKAGFELYQSLLPTRAFFNRGTLGPLIIMTDDSKTIQNTLRAIWPNATLLVCVFHILQALWRWEWDSDNKIDKRDRPDGLIQLSLRYPN